MPKLACTMTLVALALVLALPLAAESAIPDLRGTWKGESESIVLGGGNPHHTGTSPSEPQLRSVPFTLTVDKQDGRRFSGTFSSPRSNEKIVAVISRNGTIFLVDDEGYTVGTILGPTRMELCYMHVSTSSRIASCSELVRQP
jgi:hypothetical protein